jgi:hypothetical protein
MPKAVVSVVTRLKSLDCSVEDFLARHSDGQAFAQPGPVASSESSSASVSGSTAHRRWGIRADLDLELKMHYPEAHATAGENEETVHCPEAHATGSAKPQTQPLAKTLTEKVLAFWNREGGGEANLLTPLSVVTPPLATVSAAAVYASTGVTKGTG